MAIATGTRLGPYEFGAQIGAGGMGEVYRARDTRLQRDVALKILPAIFAADPARMARFEREARLLASLNHPHIAAIYGVEESDSCRALVMEFVEGPTLADRIAAGPVPMDEVLPMMKQVAEALEYAHDHGVIHRDLKPANIKVKADGTVKVLDFGLAKALEEEQTEADLRNSPTLSAVATMQGVILGTAGYMSPEQAKGKTVDRRADIWAFGVVFVELLTGKAVYVGETPAETLASVMMKDPGLGGLPAGTPPTISNLLKRCLDKDPRQRLQHIGEARIILAEVLSGAAPAEPTAGPSKGRERLLLWSATGVAAVLLLALAAVSLVHFRETPAAQRRVQFQVPPPEKAALEMFKLSPDGRYMVIIANQDSHSKMWLRPLDSLQAQALPGTEDALYPFWSPDNSFIGFFAQGKLKKIAVAGGPPQVLCDAPAGRGGTWNSDGVILFAPNIGGGLYRVPSAGGVPQPVTRVADSSSTDSDRLPEFLPGGRRFLFMRFSDQTEAAGVYAGSLDGMPPVRLLPDTSNATYVPPNSPGGTGYLLFRRETTLMAQPFDSERLQAAGEMFPVAQQVATAVNVGTAAFSASSSGVLAYWSGGAAENRQLVWMDRAGKQLGVVTTPAFVSSAKLSPDEKRLATAIRTNQNTRDIWVQDLSRGVTSRFSFSAGNSSSPVWSPDGGQLIFSQVSSVGTASSIYEKATSGAGKEELLFHGGVNTFASDWSPDGKFLVYSAYSNETKEDLWLLPLEGEHKPIPYLQTAFNEINGQFSPDGRWMAYTSDESGRQEVYVQAIPATAAKWQISSAGGSFPRWRRDGKELFYLGADQKLMAVLVKLGAAVSEGFEAGTPQPLFQVETLSISQSVFPYQPAADGQRFIVNVRALEGLGEIPITVVLNWQAGLQK